MVINEKKVVKSRTFYNLLIIITSILLNSISSLTGLCLILHLAFYQYVVPARTVAVFLIKKSSLGGQA